MKIQDIKGKIVRINGFIKSLISKINLKKIDLKNKETKKRLIISLLVAVVLIIIIARITANLQNVLFNKKQAAKEKAAISFTEEAASVKVFKIKKTEFKDTLPAIGNVKGYKEIDLKFQVAGIVESFNFEEGERIQEGDIIASLIQKDALLKLKYSEIELSKNQKLFDIGAINQIKMEQAKLEYESAKSDLDKTNIYAVSGGLLGSRVLDVGSYVTPNDKIGIFIDNAKVYAEFNIIEKDVPKVALGQKAEVFVDAYPNKSFNGVIDRIAPIIEGRSRTETIKIELDNKDGLLKPGMFTRALVATYEKKDVIVIPSSGLKKKENDYFVYLVHKEEPKMELAAQAPKEKPKNIFWPFGGGQKKEEAKPQGPKEKEAEYGAVEIRKVKLGYMTQDLVEVDEGLKEDELIIIEVQEEFKDKAMVEISEVQEGLI
ncbi:MAG: efflux RND transporter periplasmic adaptor subunit [Candidatus Omnitrophica bacterium]|nr:efflux RND transporter periplasmic adaptor subunit [Candidatus Omnitrophota bacterium]